MKVFNLKGWTVDSLVEFFLLIQGKGVPEFHRVLHGEDTSIGRFFLPHRKIDYFDTFKFVMSPDDVHLWPLTATSTKDW
mgnify:CR=1 FL=1